MIFQSNNSISIKKYSQEYFCERMMLNCEESFHFTVNNLTEITSESFIKLYDAINMVMMFVIFTAQKIVLQSKVIMSLTKAIMSLTKTIMSLTKFIMSLTKFVMSLTKAIMSLTKFIMSLSKLIMSSSRFIMLFYELITSLTHFQRRLSLIKTFVKMFYSLQHDFNLSNKYSIKINY